MQLRTLFQQCNEACPPCPEGPWVVLAKIELSESGLVRVIDNCDCRRLVLSAAQLWRKCACSLSLGVNPGGVPELGAGKSVELSIQINNLKEPVKPYAGPNVLVSSISQNPAAPNWKLTLQAEDGAKAGQRDVILTDANCSTISFPINVIPAASPETPKVDNKSEKQEVRKKRRNK